MDQSDYVTKSYIYSFVQDNFFNLQGVCENLGNATKDNKARLLTFFVEISKKNW